MRISDIQKKEFIEGKVPIHKGGHLFYRDSARSGPAVIFLHPHTGNVMSWAAQWQAIIDAGMRPIAYSRRAYAKSDFGDLGEATEFGTYAGDLLYLIDHLKIQTAYIVGVAAGAGVGLDAVLSMPERITAAVLSSGFMGLTTPKMLAQIKEQQPADFDKLPHHVKELSSNFLNEHPDKVKSWKACIDLNPNIPMPRQKFLTKATASKLAEIKLPLLLMTGSKDLFLPPQVLLQAAKAIPNAQTQIINGAAHAPHIETPKIFNDYVLSFIKKAGT